MKIMFTKNEGFTLIEVLVAILVFSFGLLGIAGMMTISVRNNHNGYLRSQASFLAENMMDRMRSNPVALWQGAYDGIAATGSAECTLADPCTYVQLAAMDMGNWAQAVEVALPNGEGSVECVANSALPSGIQPAPAPAIWLPVPPYDGVCTVTVSWTESNRESAEETQTMALIGQP